MIHGDGTTLVPLVKYNSNPVKFNNCVLTGN